ncbi:MAG: aminopeptidase P family protein [Rickettsiaceae bacterium]
MIKKRLELMRSEMEKQGFSGYIIPSCDEYLSEYTPPHAKRLEYMTGFTGSNGLAIVLGNTVLFFTDGRYITQCFSELDDHLFEVFNQQLINEFNWDEFLGQESVVAYDPKLFTDPGLKKFAKLNLKPCNENLVDKIWQQQPHKPNSKIYEYPLEYAGQHWQEKIEQCREVMTQHEANALLITDPASVCWLLNIRAGDIEFSPILLANVIVLQEKTYLFTDINRFEHSLVRDNLEVLPEIELEKILASINGLVLFDKTQCSSYIAAIVKQKQSKHLSNPCMLWKACKNKIEIECMQQGHIQDAVAVCEMLSFIASEDLSLLSEYDIGIKLTELRSKGKNYLYDSFPTICGFQENGAIIHYRASKENAKKLTDQGLLLLDSGGQYLGATTDITRTVAIGTPQKEHKELYTKVLKGHIALALARFPKHKVCGANLDILARQYLWQDGLDYAHGTGHGVGSFLSVHEGPQSISMFSGVKIEAGMVMSNEPGYYVPGQFGIRIENMMYAKESNIPGFLDFEMLTLVPYERELIEFDMLSTSEITYLSSYYQKIEQYIQPLLSDRAKKWLKNQMSNLHKMPPK